MNTYTMHVICRAVLFKQLVPESPYPVVSLYNITLGIESLQVAFNGFVSVLLGRPSFQVYKCFVELFICN